MMLLLFLLSLPLQIRSPACAAHPQASSCKLCCHIAQYLPRVSQTWTSRCPFDFTLKPVSWDSTRKQTPGSRKLCGSLPQAGRSRLLGLHPSHVTKGELVCSQSLLPRIGGLDCLLRVSGKALSTGTPPKPTNPNHQKS